jgi:TP901 family phage tail tape measure protein
MPSQDLTVRVRVQGMGAYAKSMQDGSKATKQLATAGSNVQKVGGQISGIGDKLTKSVTLPIVAVGAAAVKMSTDFDKSFTTMQTLAGLSAGEVDGLKDSVLGLSGETGRAPQELAEALYFLRSSGLEGAQAMEALEVSAKASAAGLGDTQVIADAVSSAMLGYAESGLKASEATDVLIATAKAGKAEPAELAAQMGRLIPTAAELGITFADVGGSIAALSTKGNDAAAATTQLTNVMGKLLKPSQQGAEALEEVGLSTERVRELIAEKGLLGTLEVLKERLGDSGFVKFFEDQQAVQGALALTGGDMEKTRDIFAQVNNSVGETDKAFQTWAESMGAKNAKAFADFQVAMIRFGDVIAPIAASVLSFAASVIGVFSDLPGPAQKVVVAFLAILAAVGPLMSIGGRLISTWGTVLKVFDNWTSAGGKAFASAMNEGGSQAANLGKQAGPLGAAGGLLALEAAAVVALVAIHEMGKAAHDAKIKDLTEDFLATGDAAELFGEALDGNVFEMGNAADVLDGLIDTNLEAAERFVNAAEAAGMEEDAVASAREAIEKKRQSEAQSAVDSKSNQDAIAGVTEEMADQEEAVNEAAEAFKNYADTVKATFDPVFGLLDALRSNKEAQVGVTEAQAALNTAIKEHGRNSAEAAKAQSDYEDAIIGVGQSALDVTTAAAGLNAAVAENPALLADAQAALLKWRDQGIIPTDEQLQFLQDQLSATAVEGAALGEVDPSVDVKSTGGPPTRAEMRRVKDAATDIPSRRNTHVSTTGTSAAQLAVANFRAQLDRLPWIRTVHVNAVVTSSGGLDALSGRRAHGGPVLSGRLYEVTEQGRAELLEMAGRQYLIPGSDGTVIPAGRMASAASLGGGGSTTIVQNISMAGAIIASQTDAQRWVAGAWNKAAAQGLVNVRGKRVA